MPSLPSHFDEELLHFVALSMVKNLGPVNARKLIDEFGTATEVFRATSVLRKKRKIRLEIIEELMDKNVLKLGERELRFAEKSGVRVIKFTDSKYPEKLKLCHDAPIVLYVKGNGSLNVHRSISVVGTRKSTPYGNHVCREIVSGLCEVNPIIVSGLALGIDGCAHRAALDSRLTTFAVLAHGLDWIYPRNHQKLAEEIQDTGGLVTEFATTANMVPGNFAARNRIVAGISDATVVVESGIKGGSLITADLANSYGREVFAVPGNSGLHSSAGCNWLIKSNRAALIESASDLLEYLSWKGVKKKAMTQMQLFKDLSDTEEKLIKVLQASSGLRLDEIAHKSELGIPQTAAILLELEFKRLVKTQPGKIYSLAD